MKAWSADLRKYSETLNSQNWIPTLFYLQLTLGLSKPSFPERLAFSAPWILNEFQLEVLQIHTRIINPPWKALRGFPGAPAPPRSPGLPPFAKCWQSHQQSGQPTMFKNPFKPLYSSRSICDWSAEALCRTPAARSERLAHAGTEGQRCTAHGHSQPWPPSPSATCTLTLLSGKAWQPRGVFVSVELVHWLEDEVVDAPVCAFTQRWDWSTRDRIFGLGLSCLLILT